MLKQTSMKTSNRRNRDSPTLAKKEPSAKQGTGVVDQAHSLEEHQQGARLREAFPEEEEEAK